MKLNIRHFFTFSFLFELFLFIFTLYLTLGVAVGIIIKLPSVPLSSTATSPLFFIIAILITTIILILIIKLVKSAWLIRGIFILAVLNGFWLFGTAYFDWPEILYYLAGVGFLYFIYRNILFHNIIIIMAISAISATLGLNLMPSSVIIISLFLALYDFWAVYKTKHMVEMFRGLAERQVYLSLIIPQNFKGLFKKVKEASPQTEFMFLGTGDLAVPAIFIASCLKFGLRTSLLVALGAIIGFIFLYILFVTQKERAPMPGLPPIILGCLLGYLISFLI